jgi:hypothetical protein
MMQEFKVGDIVTCINCAEEKGFFKPVTHQYKIPIPDDWNLLTLGVNYTISSVFERVIDMKTYYFVTLEECLPEIDVFASIKIFNADRFILNISETRKKKLDSLDI